MKPKSFTSQQSELPVSDVLLLLEGAGDLGKVGYKQGYN